MKIGILTVPFNNNYGGCLQAFALMTVLKRLGHHPYMIMRRHNLYSYSLLAKAKYVFRSFLNTLKYKRFDILIHPFEPYYDFTYAYKIQKFVSHYICPQTSYFYSWYKLENKLRKHFDVLIVGSDQVWRSVYVPGVENYFFNFAKNWDASRIAYAASFGTTEPEYTEEEIKTCGKLLRLFDAVSVREQGALSVFNKFNWNTDEVKVVLDPTLLLDAMAYETIMSYTDNGVPYLFAYVLDKTQDKDSAIHQVCDSHNLIVKNQYENDSLLSIEDWLGLIKNANSVVTDSFHGMVFSIIFHVPFVVVVNKERGSDRFKSLLNMLQLEDRLAYSPSKICDIIERPIDWLSVDTLLQKYRKESVSFLKMNLNQSKPKKRK